MPVCNALSLWFFMKPKASCFLFLGKIYCQVFISFFQNMSFVFSSCDLDMSVVLDLYKIIPGRLRLQYVQLRNRGYYFSSAKDFKGLVICLWNLMYLFRLYVKWTTMRRSASTVYKFCKINSLELIVQLEVTSWSILIFPLYFQ